MQRLILAVLLMLTAAGCASVSGTISPAQFRDEVAERLRAKLPGSCIRIVDARTLRFGLSASACDTLVQTNVFYEEYLRYPERRLEIQERFADSVISITSARSSDDLARRLVVLLRVPDFSTYQEEWQLVFEPFAGDVSAILLADEPGEMRGVRLPELDAIGMSRDEAFEVARQNIRSRMTERLAQTTDGVELVTSVSQIATGYLWLPESCRAEDEGSQALVLSVNGYLLVGSADASAVNKFQTMTSDFIGREISMSKTVISCRSGEWVASSES